MIRTIRFRLNGKPVSLQTEEDRKLLWVLRTDLASTGTKYGCGEGHCGSCTVVVDGEAVRSCLTRVASVEGKEVLTIEGLATDDRLHPLQQAFVEHGALQCGYCTPGMIMNAYALISARPDIDRAGITDGMEHNLCRCGAHQRIIDAIEDAVRATGGVR